MIREGQTFVWGRTRPAAQALLAAAEQAGLDPAEAVKTTAQGFVVPDEVYDLAAPAFAEPAHDDHPGPDAPGDF